MSAADSEYDVATADSGHGTKLVRVHKGNSKNLYKVLNKQLTNAAAVLLWSTITGWYDKVYTSMTPQDGETTVTTRQVSEQFKKQMKLVPKLSDKHMEHFEQRLVEKLRRFDNLDKPLAMLYATRVEMLVPGIRDQFSSQFPDGKEFVRELFTNGAQVAILWPQLFRSEDKKERAMHTLQQAVEKTVDDFLPMSEIIDQVSLGSRDSEGHQHDNGYADDALRSPRVKVQLDEPATERKRPASGEQGGSGSGGERKKAREDDYEQRGNGSGSGNGGHEEDDGGYDDDDDKENVPPSPVKTKTVTMSARTTRKAGSDFDASSFSFY